MKVSVIVPVYGCHEALRELASRVHELFDRLAFDYELILVNDASPDESWGIIEELSQTNARIKGVDFSRNFGQHFAMSAGIDYASGDWLVTMDCDLQDPPEEIEKLLTKAQEGFDIVYGVGTFRSQNTFLSKTFSKLYYRIYDFLRGGRQKSLNASFTLMSRRVADSFRQLRERKRQFLTQIGYLGYRSAVVRTDHIERPRGQSSYSFMKRVALAFNGIVSGTTRLLRLGIYVGLTFSLGSMASGSYIVARKLLVGDYTVGWPSVMTTIFFVGGIIMLLVGILGIYMETIFYEVKARPMYIVRQTTNLTADPNKNSSTQTTPT